MYPSTGSIDQYGLSRLNIGSGTDTLHDLNYNISLKKSTRLLLVIEDTPWHTE